uniref:6-phosphogluconolactonase n=1 Tax=Panagrolaimus sp. ES5 TaxID=591445 RepID=A0AC34FYE1_9BILA
MSAYFAVGCYSRPPRATKSQENGLFIVKLDLETGSLKMLSKYNEVQNISFFSKFKDHLFAVTENEQSILHRFKIRYFEARSTEANGGIERTPVLELEHSFKFDVAGACFISTNEVKNEDGVNVAVACYDDGAIKLFKSDENGLKEISNGLKLKDCVDPNSDRQEAPHAHCILPWKGKSDTYALVDLGADRIYQIKATSDSLKIDESKTFEAPPRSGPRHLIFHPSRPLAFLITELSNELLILSTENEKLSILNKYPLIGYPESTVNFPKSEIQNAAHISLSKNGKYILCSNRGNINDIIVFKLDEEKAATAEFLQAFSTGEFPRYFEIIDDRFLIILNQKSHTLVVYNFKNGGQIDSAPLCEMPLESPIAIFQL